MNGPDLMLAFPSSRTPEQSIYDLVRGGWWFEIKFDGIRAAINRDTSGTVRIFNRRQVEITHRYPDVVAALADVSFTGWLDGEIVVLDANARPDFTGAHIRDAQSAPKRIAAVALQWPAEFVPFDVLEWQGRDLRPLTYELRRDALDELGIVSSLASQDGPTLWKFVEENKLEGLVAKRGDSAYRPGRQRAWQKIKRTHRVSALVCGVQAGRGSRGAVGALQLCLYDPQDRSLVGVGKVGSGLSDSELTWMREHIGSDGKPTESIVVEVEYLEVSASGQLRNPVYRGRRQDIDPVNCTLDTLHDRRMGNIV